MSHDALADLIHYFEPVQFIHPAIRPVGLENNIVKEIQVHRDSFSPNIESAKIFLVGHPHAQGVDEIRAHFYSLAPVENGQEIVDLGNFRNGKKATETLAAWEDFLYEMGKHQKVLVILGGPMEENGSTINGLNKLEHPINLALISPDIHLIPNTQEIESSYLNRALLDPESHLFDYVHLAYQGYFTDPEVTEFLDKLHFQHVRLGEIRQQIQDAEPYLRNSDLLIFSMAAIRHSDAPNTRLQTANGLYAEEACQLARYAGLSDRLSVFTLCDYKDGELENKVTYNLCAQIIWHFIQAVQQRKQDYPFASIKSYSKYIVNLPATEHELVFYKSPKTDRWWLEVPYPDAKYPRSVYVACTIQDYQMASNGEIPDRWVKNYQRIC